MQVNVEHRLTSVLAIVDHNSIAVSQVQSLCALFGRQEQFAQQRLI
jgi:hypothetical protein